MLAFFFMRWPFLGFPCPTSQNKGTPTVFQTTNPHTQLILYPTPNRFRPFCLSPLFRSNITVSVHLSMVVLCERGRGRAEIEGEEEEEVASLFFFFFFFFLFV